MNEYDFDLHSQIYLYLNSCFFFDEINIIFKTKLEQSRNNGDNITSAGIVKVNIVIHQANKQNNQSLTNKQSVSDKIIISMRWIHLTYDLEMMVIIGIEIPDEINALQC